MGDTFSNISGSTIVNRSLIQGAVDSLKQSRESESAEALRQLAGLVEQSGSSDASEYLNALSEELQQPTPRKTIVRSMWDGILRVLPSVAQAVTITAGIENLVVDSIDIEGSSVRRPVRATAFITLLRSVLATRRIGAL